MKSLRIAQIAPLFESVPPLLYGGTERVVSTLTETLTALGHEVTLFASGDSLTSARLVPIGRQALRLSGVKESLAPHLLMFERLRLLADEFDVIHFHNEYSHFSLARSLDVPTVSTLHGRLDLPEYRDLFAEFGDLPLISISDSQRRPLPKQNWLCTIHHGMRFAPAPIDEKPREYLAFLGRISPDKGIVPAIEIARRSGLKLKVAAKVDRQDLEYHGSIRAQLEDPCVEFIGEIGDREKPELLGGARALLFPIDWPEPFGLVMIEALAAGTPVIAFRKGSVPEVIAHGRTGFIVDDVDGAVDAVGRLHEISRAECRRECESRFSAERMAEDYVAAYRRVIVDQRVENKFHGLNQLERMAMMAAVPSVADLSSPRHSSPAGGFS